MECEILFTDEFGEWWDRLNTDEQESIRTVVIILRTHGVTLGYPYSSKIATSRYSHMRELRIQHEGRPYRVLYAFDPQRNAVLLVGGDKTGVNRWYEIFVPLADRIYEQYLSEIEKEK